MNDNDQREPVNYGEMFTPGETGLDPVPVTEERIFGATAVVGDVELVYDETNEMWVFANDRDQLWLGDTPTPDSPSDDVPEEVVEEAEVEPEPTSIFDASEALIKVNLDEGGQLRLRNLASTDSEVVTMLDAETILRVLADDDPTWAFVEVVGVSDVRGYVNKTFTAPYSV